MQHPYAIRQPALTPMVRRLMIVTGGAFLLQSVIDAVTGGWWSSTFALSMWGLRHLMIWQPLTYLFLHGNLMHLLMNMLGLFFLGPETERSLGSRLFLKLYLVSGVIGGVGWALTGSNGLCVGASGAVFGVLGAFVAMYPNRPMMLILFPVPIKAWVLACGVAAFELFSMLTVRGAGIAYGVHLVGIAAGVAFVRFPRLFGGRSRSRVGRPPRSPGGFSAAEIDRLLDKISRQGVQSLTAEERSRLEEASRQRRYTR